MGAHTLHSCWVFPPRSQAMPLLRTHTAVRAVARTAPPFRTAAGAPTAVQNCSCFRCYSSRG